MPLIASKILMAVDDDTGGETAEGKEFKNANAFRFRENKGELLVYSLGKDLGD
jgi:hypothetical protein